MADSAAVAIAKTAGFRANLRRADLREADLRGATLPTGETWETYLAEVVPALCTAGGVSLAAVAARWDCHNWTNCPMATAFGTHDLSGVPALLRPRAEQFIQLFDSGLIPCPDAAHLPAAPGTEKGE